MVFDEQKIKKLCTLIRSYILRSTTAAGSGHPSSSLSAVELMTTLMFGGFFQAKLDNPVYANNDRLIFSKGHASPLFYSLYAAAGRVSEEELLTLRKFGSNLEGHPAPTFLYTEVPTGSLGQGLSVGLGMALNAKYLDHASYRTFVLLGDSEMSEGQVWEAIQVAKYYNLSNLVAIVDVNRLGQRGPTMLQYDILTYQERISAFGWEVLAIDGHSISAIAEAYTRALQSEDHPVMILAHTLKGKGVSFIENKDGWHGKPLKQEECDKALQELGTIDSSLRGEVAAPQEISESVSTSKVLFAHDALNYETPASGTSLSGTEVLFPAKEVPSGGFHNSEQDELTYTLGEKVATRKAYGLALAHIIKHNAAVVALDAEVSNSTFAELVKKDSPEKFFEMFVAEQNMVGVAMGLSRRGKIPFVSSFAAFLSRAFDQIRMAQYAQVNIKFCGSHAGVSIGEDGPSQMGLEDIAMFRTLHTGVVVYPSDAVSTKKLMHTSVTHSGIVYIRTTRAETPVLYESDEHFPIGGSKVLRKSAQDVVTVVGAGITLHEALQAHEELAREGIAIRVVDLYSIKPLDAETLLKCARETKAVITVEDHYPEGGIGEAVAMALAGTGVPLHSLAVRKTPTSGKPQELLEFEEISAATIIKTVRSILPFAGRL